MGELFHKAQHISKSSIIQMLIQKDHNLAWHGCDSQRYFQSITLKALCIALTRKSKIDQGRPNRMKGCAGPFAHGFHYHSKSIIKESV